MALADWTPKVLDILLSPWHCLIDGAEESYLWLFSCSMLINNPTSFACLQQAVIKYVLQLS